MRQTNLLALLVLSFANVRAADMSSFCFETPNPPGSLFPTSDNTLSCQPGSMSAEDYFNAMRLANISVSTDGANDCASVDVSELALGTSSSQHCTLYWHSFNPPYLPAIEFLNKTVSQQTPASSDSPKASSFFTSPAAIALYVLLPLACLACAIFSRHGADGERSPLLGGGGLGFCAPGFGCFRV